MLTKNQAATLLLDKSLYIEPSLKKDFLQQLYTLTKRRIASKEVQRIDTKLASQINAELIYKALIKQIHFSKYLPDEYYPQAQTYVLNIANTASGRALESSIMDLVEKLHSYKQELTKLLKEEQKNDIDILDTDNDDGLALKVRHYKKLHKYNADKMLQSHQGVCVLPEEAQKKENAMANIRKWKEYDGYDKLKYLLQIAYPEEVKHEMFFKCIDVSISPQQVGYQQLSCKFAICQKTVKKPNSHPSFIIDLALHNDTNFKQRMISKSITTIQRQIRKYTFPLRKLDMGKLKRPQEFVLQTYNKEECIFYLMKEVDNLKEVLRLDQNAVQESYKFEIKNLNDLNDLNQIKFMCCLCNAKYHNANITVLQCGHTLCTACFTSLEQKKCCYCKIISDKPLLIGQMNYELNPPINQQDQELISQDESVQALQRYNKLFCTPEQANQKRVQELQLENQKIKQDCDFQSLLHKNTYDECLKKLESKFQLQIQEMQQQIQQYQSIISTDPSSKLLSDSNKENSQFQEISELELQQQNQCSSFSKSEMSMDQYHPNGSGKSMNSQSSLNNKFGHVNINKFNI